MPGWSLASSTRGWRCAADPLRSPPPGRLPRDRRPSRFLVVAVAMQADGYAASLDHASGWDELASAQAWGRPVAAGVLAALVPWELAVTGPAAGLRGRVVVDRSTHRGHSPSARRPALELAGFRCRRRGDVAAGRRVRHRGHGAPRGSVAGGALGTTTTRCPAGSPSAPSSPGWRSCPSDSASCEAEFPASTSSVRSCSSRLCPC